MRLTIAPTAEFATVIWPAPLIANGHIIIALPDGGHVIKNAITSEGGQNFMVDGMLVIPVTSEAK